MDRTDGARDGAAAWGRASPPTAAGPGAGTGGAGWLPWALRWFAATLLTFVLAMVAYLAPGAREQPLQLVFPLLLAPALAGMIVLPMTLAAAALRWLWWRLAPQERRASASAAILTGMAAGPLALLVWFAVQLVLSDGARLVTGRDTLGSLLAMPFEVAFAPPLLIAGGAAGYLAHRQVSLRSARWWLVLLAAAALSLLGAALYTRLT